MIYGISYFDAISKVYRKCGDTLNHLITINKVLFDTTNFILATVFLKYLIDILTRRYFFMFYPLKRNTPKFSTMFVVIFHY